MCNCQSHPCRVSRVQSHQVLCQLFDRAVYLPFKDACLGILHFFWLHSSIWFSSGVCLRSVDGSASVLEIFFRLHNSTSPSLLIMMSLFILWYFEHGRTDWDSQYFKLGGGVLCHHSPRQI